MCKLCFQVSNLRRLWVSQLIEIWTSETEMSRQKLCRRLIL